MAQSAIPMPEKLGKVKVLAAESTRMNSQLLAEALAQDSRLDVAAVEPNQALILAAVGHQRPDVVLISSALESGTQGFDLARQISSSFPETQLILLMDSSNPASVVQAFRSGAHGVFSRTESSKSLAKCIHSVHQGQVWANSAELRCVIEALRESEPMRLVDSGGDAILSKREQDVVRCVAEGLSNREIANSLGLTEHTVKNYLFRIFDKLGVSSRVEVVLYVYRFRQDWVGSSAKRSNAAPALGPKLLTKPANRTRTVAPPAVVGER
jgi:two-component system, NarL family, nitrate/nitrite response regulator NarL